MKNNKGISLIVLIITIIVVVILAAVVVLTLSKNNPIESAKEARFKEDIRTFQDELALYISKQYANAGGHWDGNISAKTYNEIINYIPSFTKKYEGKFVINNNNLEYTNKLDDKGKEYVQSLNVREKVKLLPDEFRQVEYIESTGTQYIDTRINSNTNMFIELEMSYNNNTPQWGCIFGIVNSINNTNTYIAPNSTWDKNKFYYHLPNTLNWENSFVSFTTNKTRIIYDGINGNIKAYTYSINFAPINYDFNANMYLFAYRNLPIQTIQPASAKIYNCYISKDNITRNFIPCYSTTSVTNVDGKQVPANTKGLYDTVEGKFYTNQGTGVFIAGPDVNE